MRLVPQENLDDRGRAKSHHRQKQQSYSGSIRYPAFPEDLHNSYGIESPVSIKPYAVRLLTIMKNMMFCYGFKISLIDLAISIASCVVLSAPNVIRIVPLAYSLGTLIACKT